MDSGLNGSLFSAFHKLPDCNDYSLISSEDVNDISGNNNLLMLCCRWLTVVSCVAD